MLNCCSLDWIGPIMEDLSGPKRYLAIYMTSAVACSTMSYWFCQGSAVGASGAIFGLVGSYAVYLIRHKNMVDNWAEELWDVVSLIAMNLAIGCELRFVDDWGHVSH
ncbi:RHOMBOID-like protein 10, chloroplastic [Rutidosis leptorrhynchoides]|uniref:RHOMBOID-like protein 10, chloroplastic n=1 Tax=Rutidosis leptorrhynchoides TaxID=125765 RepID=UPI003A9A57AC